MFEKVIALAMVAVLGLISGMVAVPYLADGPAALPDTTICNELVCWSTHSLAETDTITVYASYANDYGRVWLVVEDEPGADPEDTLVIRMRKLGANRWRAIISASWLPVPITNGDVYWSAKWVGNYRVGCAIPFRCVETSARTRVCPNSPVGCGP